MRTNHSTIRVMTGVTQLGRVPPPPVVRRRPGGRVIPSMRWQATPDRAAARLVLGRARVKLLAWEIDNDTPGIGPGPAPVHRKNLGDRINSGLNGHHPLHTMENFRRSIVGATSTLVAD